MSLIDSYSYLCILGEPLQYYQSSNHLPQTARTLDSLPIVTDFLPMVTANSFNMVTNTSKYKKSKRAIFLFVFSDEPTLSSHFTRVIRVFKMADCRENVAWALACVL